MHQANVIEHGAQAAPSERRPVSKAGQAAAHPWLASYPPGVPAEIDAARLGTLVELEQV